MGRVMSLPIVTGRWMYTAITYHCCTNSSIVCTIQYFDKPQIWSWHCVYHSIDCLVFMNVSRCFSQCDYRFWLSSDCFNGWKCEFVKGARVRLSDCHDHRLVTYLGLHLVRAWKLIWRTVKWDETRSTNECAKHIPQLPAYLQRMTEQRGAPTFVLENPGDEWCTWKRSIL